MERPPWVDAGLYPFEDRWLEVDGSRVHYVDEGSGPPLLLLHGNPTWSFLYRRIIPGLSGRFRCIAPDYPGFGLSAPAPGYGFRPAEHAEVIERLVLELDLRDAGIMVQDWGGPIGLAAATRHPERFARLVIGNTWAWSMRDHRLAGAFSRALGSTVGRRLIQQRNLFVERLMRLGVARAPLSDEVMDHYRGPFPTPASRLPTWVFPREILGSTAFLEDVEERLPALADRPALVVWGDKDAAFREQERERWEALLGDLHTVLLEGAGHYIQEEAPDEIVAAILARFPAG